MTLPDGATSQEETRTVTLPDKAMSQEAPLREAMLAKTTPDGATSHKATLREATLTKTRSDGATLPVTASGTMSTAGEYSGRTEEGNQSNIFRRL